MKKNLRKLFLAAPMVLLLAIMFAFSAGTAFAAPTSTSSTWSGMTTGYANVRIGTNTGTTIVTTYAPNTPVTVYATTPGQVVWGGISAWYRISSLSSAPRYIYGGLVTHSPADGGPTVSAQGKLIVVSRTKQWLYAYENGTLVYNMPVTTGRPELATPLGTFHVFRKLSPTTFYSPWPQGSPYWYAPTHINYALQFTGSGVFLHDATWRSTFGPGTNVWHYDPKFGWMTGTHGCVTMSLSNAKWLYGWAPNGTTVKIIN